MIAREQAHGGGLISAYHIGGNFGASNVVCVKKFRATKSVSGADTNLFVSLGRAQPRLRSVSVWVDNLSQDMRDAAWAMFCCRLSHRIRLSRRVSINNNFGFIHNMIRNDRFRLRLKCAQVSAVHTQYQVARLARSLSNCAPFPSLTNHKNCWNCCPEICCISKHCPPCICTCYHNQRILNARELICAAAQHVFIQSIYPGLWSLVQIPNLATIVIVHRLRNGSWKLSQAFDSFSIPFQLLSSSVFRALRSVVRARLQKSMKYFSGGTLRASLAWLHFAFALW